MTYILVFLLGIAVAVVLRAFLVTNKARGIMEQEKLKHELSVEREQKKTDEEAWNDFSNKIN